MTHFIETYPGALSRERCEAIIARFEADPRRHASRTMRGVNEKVRSGTMLDIAEYDEWADVRDEVHEVFHGALKQYAAKYQVIERLARPEVSFLSPPLLERIDPGQGYDYHIDAGPGGTYTRILSSILYLRDIEGSGFTEFPYQGIRTPPVQGMLVIFPPFWTHLHRGATPEKGVKYNITNFLCFRTSAQDVAYRATADR